MTQVAKLSIIPLTEGLVLLPGAAIRIPLIDRPDISIVLSSLFNDAGIRTTATTTEDSSLYVGCVPLHRRSYPYEIQKHDGDLAHEQPQNTASSNDTGVSGLVISNQSSGISRKDLYQFGTLAKVVGIQAHPRSESSIIVEGIRRLSIVNFFDDESSFKAETLIHDESKSYWPRWGYHLYL